MFTFNIVGKVLVDYSTHHNTIHNLIWSVYVAMQCDSHIIACTRTIEIVLVIYTGDTVSD